MTERLYLITNGDRIYDHPTAIRAATASTLVVMLEKCADEIEAQKIGNDAQKRSVSIYLQICDLEVGQPLVNHVAEPNELVRLAAENAKLREERDEARRQVCEFEMVNMKCARDYATYRGWDCYNKKKED